jgi:hypothetical protein
MSEAANERLKSVGRHWHGSVCNRQTERVERCLLKRWGD